MNGFSLDDAALDATGYALARAAFPDDPDLTPDNWRDFIVAAASNLMDDDLWFDGYDEDVDIYGGSNG